MTFEQRRNRLTTHFSERIPVDKRRVSVLRPCTRARTHARTHTHTYIYIIVHAFLVTGTPCIPYTYLTRLFYQLGTLCRNKHGQYLARHLPNNRLQKAVTSVTTIWLSACNNSTPARLIFMAKLLEYFHCLSVGLIFVNVGKAELCSGTIAKLRNATVSFVTSGRQCVST